MPKISDLMLSNASRLMLPVLKNNDNSIKNVWGIRIWLGSSYKISIDLDVQDICLHTLYVVQRNFQLQLMKFWMYVGLVADPKI